MRRADDRVPAQRSQILLAHELLSALRVHLARERLTFAAPPQRLRGGFFTENQAFRLAGAPAGWDDELVVRLFPRGAPADLAFREAAVQTALTDQGYPAAPVRWFDDTLRLDDRRFFVMARLPGRTVIGGTGPRELLRAARFGRRLPEITAEVQAALHRLDVTSLVARLGDGADGVDRAVARLRSVADRGAEGLRPAADWLETHRPPASARRVVCHGDLWGGNILVDEAGSVSGVLDWTTSAVGEPALDVGATAMAFCFVPVTMPGPVRALVQRRGRSIYESYLRAYEALTGADLGSRPYYEAMRAAAELSFVAEWRLAQRTGDHELPRPSWDVISDELIGFVRDRTGITITLPECATRCDM